MLLPIKQWQLWQGNDSMQDISAGAAHGLQKCPLEKSWLLWGSFVGEDSNSTPLWLFHETLTIFQEKKFLSFSGE